MFLQTIVILSCISFMLVEGQINTNICSTLANNIEVCNNATSVSGYNSGVSIGVAVGFYNQDQAVYCADQTNFKTVVGCIMGHVITCGTADQKTLVASADAYKGAIDEICADKADVDYTCFSEIPVCATNDLNKTVPAYTAPIATLKEYYCGSITSFRKCINTNTKLNNCAKTKTKSAIMDVFVKLIPSACGGASTIIFSGILLATSILCQFF